ICLAMSPIACDLSEPEPETVRSTQEMIAAACPTRRQIAVRESLDGPCPSVTGWTAASVFAEGPGVLGEFCRYRWTIPHVAPNVEALTAEPELLSVGSDCEVVFEQGGADALWDVIGSQVQTL